MARDPQSLIPLLSVSRGGATVRCAAWPESICSHGEHYEPHPFMFVLGGEDRTPAWRRVEIYIDRAVIFPAQFPGEGPISATVRFIMKRDQGRIIQQVDGVLTIDDDKIYIEPIRINSPA